MTRLDTALTRQLGIKTPIICGAMYPCSNPELVAAVSEAGGIGIVQPISLTYVHGHDFRQGLRLIRQLTARPIGMNALIEHSSRRYRERMSRWIDIALEEGVRFFVTSLGKPDWVVKQVAPFGAVVYHDATERKWALKGVGGGVQGLIAVNESAGGHAGEKTAEKLFDELADLDVPLICAGGIGDPRSFAQALAMGYAGVQMGTRFIATRECRASDAYKQAIIDAGVSDIVHSERITGVPVALIRTPYVERLGLRASPLARRMLQHPRAKHLMRMLYTLRSLYKLKHSSQASSADRHTWQAGKSVAGIEGILPAAEIIRQFSTALDSGGSDHYEITK